MCQNLISASVIPYKAELGKGGASLGASQVLPLECADRRKEQSEQTLYVQCPAVFLLPAG